MKLNEIKLSQIKKNFKFKTASFRYHNKHKDGSGNFGTNLTKGTWGQNDWQNWEISGEYDNNKELYCLNFGRAYQIGATIVNKKREINRATTTEDFIKIIELIIKESD